jgi:aryl-alcohol dehydrogenase-like predicted oxidoreductase
MKLIKRRMFLKSGCALAAGSVFWPQWLWAGARPLINKVIATSGEKLHVIGMGSSRTFDVGDNVVARSQLAPVLQVFFDQGGALIDSSPMYGSAEQVIGDLLKTTRNKGSLFAATKVWTDGKQAGIEQMQRSMQRMGVNRFDLMQIHNLQDWQVHLETLKAWKEAGRIRYLGITTSHGRFHEELESILELERFDFVQFSYNIADRAVEKRLLPLAAERGTSVLINRPYQQGVLFRAVKGKALPEWAAECDCATWAQFFLKFIVSHPAVTCVIPATTKVHHMMDNMAAGFGRLPDAKQRERMLAYFKGL